MIFKWRLYASNECIQDEAGERAQETNLNKKIMQEEKSQNENCECTITEICKLRYANWFTSEKLAGTWAGVQASFSLSSLNYQVTQEEKTN